MLNALDHLMFAFVYALRNMLRDRQRTAFALLSIGAGVATVVALRTLGLMLTDALTLNAQAFLRGDVRVVSGSNEGTRISLGGTRRDFAFSSANVPQINKWAADHNVQVTYTLTSELMQMVRIQDDRAGRPALAMGIFIDPRVYPFYDSIRAEEPRGTPLKNLFTGPSQTVVGRRLASQTGVKVGDLMRVGTAKDLYTVTGIVPDSAESTLDNLSGLLFSFVYLDRAAMPQFGLPPDVAERAYMKLPPDLTPAAAVSQVRGQWPRPATPPPFWHTFTVDEELIQNTTIADTVSRFVLLLSLVGLLIGGVGIINTMLVVVNRRSTEIAVLKTLGLQGADISLVFLAEAIVAGLVGSVLGIILGTVLSLFARDLGQEAFAVALPWRLYLEPMLIGMALGLAMTVVFSILPTLMAGQVRPNLVLRQGNIPIARAGCLPTLLSLAVLIVGLGLLADLIIGHFGTGIRVPAPLTPGIVGSFVVFVLLGLSVVLLWIPIWLLGHLPSFRLPSLHIAVRGLTTHRSRTAFSLLALVLGMTALSGTLILARSLNILLYTSIRDPLGGNMVIIPLLPVRDLVHTQLDGASGVSGYRDVRIGQSGTLRAINGTPVYVSQLAKKDDAQAQMRIASLDLLLGVNVYGNPPRGTLMDGRFLGPEDAGKANLVMPYIPELDKFGLKVGSTVTYGSGSQSSWRTFEVVGIVAPDASTGLIPFSLSDSAVQAPLDTVKSTTPFDFVIADVKPEALNDAMAIVATTPGVLVFDVSIFDSLISRILDQLAALPLLIAGLSLFAATALIATTVSLATMERRR
ncbi:MAG TPA: FtsX-like permease family protein, partial [Aggregatilineales bacterium]|nr:FtsX-like permease family protein [Aggregatilineales bacterium]